MSEIFIVARLPDGRIARTPVFLDSDRPLNITDVKILQQYLMGELWNGYLMTKEFIGEGEEVKKFLPHIESGPDGSVILMFDKDATVGEIMTKDDPS